MKMKQMGEPGKNAPKGKIQGKNGGPDKLLTPDRIVKLLESLDMRDIRKGVETIEDNIDALKYVAVKAEKNAAITAVETLHLMFKKFYPWGLRGNEDGWYGPNTRLLVAVKHIVVHSKWTEVQQIAVETIVFARRVELKSGFFGMVQCPHPYLFMRPKDAIEMERNAIERSISIWEAICVEKRHDEIRRESVETNFGDGLREILSAQQ